jgi:diguanylate cyclase (GGDEF)-like protein
MALGRKPNILLLANDPIVARARAQSLASEADKLWQAWEEVPGGEQVDVIVIEGPGCDASGKVCSAVASFDAGGVAGFRPLIVQIGDGIDAAIDLALPADVTSRELQLACRLLARIGLLQRERDLLGRQHRASLLLAETDVLTGLANRRVWEEEISSRGRQVTAGETNGWLAIADLDRFKQVNDLQGYSAGDRALARASQVMAAHLRRDDLLARIGGDEFGILLSGLDEGQVRMVFERLVAAVRRETIGDEQTSLSVSVGYGPLMPHAPPQQSFALAERGLRAAKLAGGNCVVAGHALPPANPAALN